MAELQLAYNDARLIVVMGSTACGKSTIGSALAEQLNAVFIEGDDYHSTENKSKMACGTPLTDEDRWLWLQNLGELMRAQKSRVVTSCSALRKVYRQHIAEYANEPVLFVYLRGSKTLLESRLEGRKNHFMNKALLTSQLETLEIPDSTEFSLSIDIDTDQQTICANILALVKQI